MAWEVIRIGGRALEAGVYNPSGGWFIETRQTEKDALAYACELMRSGHGVHSVWQEGSHEPKYRGEDIAALVNAPSAYRCIHPIRSERSDRCEPTPRRI